MQNRKILNGWKEIAKYLGMGVRTVQRYERTLNFPVRRLAGKRRSAVIAFADEIDLWIEDAPRDNSGPAVTSENLLRGLRQRAMDLQRSSRALAMKIQVLTARTRQTQA